MPDPLHGALVWLGRAVSDPLAAIGRLADRIGSDFPGGVTGFWVAAAVLLVLAVSLLTSRRARTRLERGLDPVAGAHLRPADLERLADGAERDGRWQEAIRLKFQAGLLRLDERGGPGSSETTPNHSLARILDSPQLAQISSRFDEIIYGGDHATAGDVEGQRRGWAEILSGDRR